MPWRSGVPHAVVGAGPALASAAGWALCALTGTRPVFSSSATAASTAITPSASRNLLRMMRLPFKVVVRTGGVGRDRGLATERARCRRLVVAHHTPGGTSTASPKSRAARTPNRPHGRRMSLDSHLISQTSERPRDRHRRRSFRLAEPPGDVVHRVPELDAPHD